MNPERIGEGRAPEEAEHRAVGSTGRSGIVLLSQACGLARARLALLDARRRTGDLAQFP